MMAAYSFPHIHGVDMLTVTPPQSAWSDDWRSEALCKTDYELYGRTIDANDERDALKAKVICGVCPVQTQCLNSVLNESWDYEQMGVVGGTTTYERRQFRTLEAAGRMKLHEMAATTTLPERIKIRENFEQEGVGSEKLAGMTVVEVTERYGVSPELAQQWLGVRAESTHEFSSKAQRQVILDILSDGEWHRRDYVRAVARQSFSEEESLRLHGQANERENGKSYSRLSAEGHRIGQILHFLIQKKGIVEQRVDENKVLLLRLAT